MIVSAKEGIDLGFGLRIKGSTDTDATLQLRQAHQLTLSTAKLQAVTGCVYSTAYSKLHMTLARWSPIQEQATVTVT